MSVAAKKKYSRDKDEHHLQLVKEFEERHHAAEDAHDPLLPGGHSKKVEEGEGPWLVSYADMMTLLMGFFALIASFSKPDAKEFDKVAAAASQYFGGEYEAPYEQLSQSLRRIIEENNLEDKVQIDTSVEGVTMTFSGTLFFDSGNYVVKPEAAGLLNKMIPAVKQDTTPYNILIEGHTDTTPMRHDIIASNWELSGLRAARIAQFFEANSFTKEQLTIMGWGETKPIAPNQNPDGSPNLTNMSKNRRVVIRIYKDLPK